MNLRNRFQKRSFRFEWALRIILCAMTITFSAKTLYVIWKPALPAQKMHGNFALPKEESPRTIIQKLKRYNVELGKLEKQVGNQKIPLVFTQRLRVRRIETYGLTLQKEFEAIGAYDTPITRAKKEQFSEILRSFGSLRMRIRSIEQNNLQAMHVRLKAYHRTHTYGAKEMEKFLKKYRPSSAIESIAFTKIEKQRETISNISIPTTPYRREWKKRLKHSYGALVLFGFISVMFLTLLQRKSVFMRFFMNPTDLLKLCFPIVGIYGTIMWKPESRQRFDQRCEVTEYGSNYWRDKKYEERKNSFYETKLALQRAIITRIVSYTINAMTAIISLVGIGAPGLAYAKKITASQKSKKTGEKEREDNRGEIPVSASALLLGTLNRNGLDPSARIQVATGNMTGAKLKIETMAIIGTNAFFPGVGLSLSPWKWFQTALLARYRLTMDGEWQHGWDMEWRLTLVFTSLLKVWLSNYIWINPNTNTVSAMHLWRILPFKALPFWLGFHWEWSTNWADPAKTMAELGGFIGIKNAGVTVSCNIATPAREGCKITLGYCGAF